MKPHFLILTCTTTLILLINRCNSFYYNGHEAYNKRESDMYQDLSNEDANIRQSLLLNTMLSTRLDEDTDILTEEQRERRGGKHCTRHNDCKGPYRYCSMHQYCHTVQCNYRNFRQLDYTNDLSYLQFEGNENRDRNRRFDIKDMCGNHEACGYGRHCSCHHYCVDG